MEEGDEDWGGRGEDWGGRSEDWGRWMGFEG